MKIQFVSYSDLEGGAARAQHTLGKYINQGGDAVTLNALKVKTDEEWVIKNHSFFLKVYSYLSPFLNKILLPGVKKQHLEKWSSFLVLYSPFKIDKIFESKLHLHWVAGGMLSFFALAKKNKKIFITLHDAWFYTAGCHINYKCENYLSACNNCPQAGDKLGNVVVKLNYWLKKNFLKKTNPVVIAPSSFIYNQAKNSSMLKNHQIILVPNIVDLQVYKPLEKKNVRKILGLNENDFYIIFVGKDFRRDQLKGYKRFVEIANKLYDANIRDIRCLIVGSSNAEEIKLDSKCYGNAEDQNTMNLLYSASDLMVNTSYFESFGLTALESIASGTPVVGFDSGGTRDIVKNGISGYLGADIQAIVDKILALYKNSKELKSLSASCITYANKKFSPTMVAKKMIKIYGSN